jgi:putative protease
MRAKMEEQEIGYISNFLNKISVAIIEMTDGTLAVGNTIHILGRSTDFTETVSSMEIDHVSVDTVKKGDSLGLRVSENTRRKDKVYKVIED